MEKVIYLIYLKIILNKIKWNVIEINKEKNKKDKEIFKKYNSLVLGFFYKKTSNVELAKELSAETMSKIIMKYDKLNNIKCMDNWVFIISKNHFTDYLKKIKAKKYKNFVCNDDITTIIDKNSNYEIKPDYQMQFDKVKEAMVFCQDEELKKFFYLRYINVVDSKTIMKELNLNHNKIKKYEDKLIKFLQQKIKDNLFM
jgi:RNA polymerase sigma factor (sigma-70 family)